MTHVSPINTNTAQSGSANKPFIARQAYDWKQRVLAQVMARARLFAFVPAMSAHTITKDILTYSAIALLLILIIKIVLRDARASAAKAAEIDTSLELERNALEKRISERTEQYVLAEQSRLAELERVARFGTLAQGLFHDLMNPLTSVTLYVERLSKTGASNSEGIAVVQQALSASHRMRSFMDSVRKCLATESKQTETRADLSEEVHIVRDMMAYKARQMNVELEIETPDAVFVEAHPQRVYQLVLNLVSNAIESFAGLQERPERNLVTVNVIREHNSVHLTVTDNGHGMNTEQQAKLFKQTFTTKEYGTGIGMMTVKRIVQEMNASIDVRSEISFGTTISVSVKN